MMESTATSDFPYEMVEFSKFVSDICKDHQQGYGLIPFVGSGLSLASGIPTGQQIGRYLTKRLQDVLGHPAAPANQTGWSPYTGKWPDISEVQTDEETWAWISAVHETVKQQQRSADDAKRNRLRILWEATGSMANWLSTLHFLSRLVFDRNGNAIDVGISNFRVKDAFFTHITRDKLPNVAHLMLAQLAEPLRIRTILTTNFDSLIEDAFTQLSMPITGFDVHERASLPDASLIFAQRSLIKLHGGRYGLRADFSLHEKPSEDDRRTFGDYFKDVGLFETRDHLLVLGFSGSDTRIMRLIKHAAYAGNVQRIYWVCHQPDELAKIPYSFQNATIDLQHPMRGVPKLILTHHQELGLLLLGLYQRICRSLPPIAIDFPAFWKIPAEPYNPSPDFQQIFTTAKTTLAEKIGCEGLAKECPHLIVVDGEAGVSSVAASLFQDLSARRSCIWMGMEGYYRPSDFYASLIYTIAQKAGMTVSIPPTIVFNETKTGAAQSYAHHKALLGQYLAHIPDPVIVFLNAREGFGVNAGMNDERWCTARIHDFFSLLQTIKQPGIIFIVIDDQLKGKPGSDTILHDILTSRYTTDEYVFLKQPRSILSNNETILLDVEHWIDATLESSQTEAAQRRRFLYALTLFRHARYPAVLWTWPFIGAAACAGDRVEGRAAAARQYILALQTINVVRLKRGGLVWMHEEIKKSIRLLLEESIDFQERIDCHKAIADWYGNLFRASKDPHAALEAVYHRMQCTDRLEEEAKCENPSNPVISLDYQMESSLREAITILKLARDRILACGYIGASIDVIQVIRGRMRYLQGIPSDDGKSIHVTPPLAKLAHELEIVCLELMRDFSNEVADFDYAIDRNSEISNLLQDAGPDAEHGSRQFPNLKQLVPQYKHAIFLTGLRAYSHAESVSGDLLHEIRFVTEQQRIWDVWGSNDLNHVQARTTVRDWITRHAPSMEIRSFAVKLLRRCLRLQLLCAEADGLQVTQLTPLTLAESEAVTSRLNCCEIIFVMSTELLRYIDDQHFVEHERARLRTHYAMSLAYTQRFVEAHRRLNEAISSLSHSSEANNLSGWAVIDLHRAHLYLCQAAATFDTHTTGERLDAGLQRKILAHIDAADVSLKHARERMLSNKKESWWWTWLHELEMTACLYTSRLQQPLNDTSTSALNACEISANYRIDLALGCTACVTPFQTFIQLFKDGNNLIRLDILRQGKMLHLLIAMIQSMRTGNACIIDTSCLHELMAQCIPFVRSVMAERATLGDDMTIDHRIIAYLHHVIALPTAWEARSDFTSRADRRTPAVCHNRMWG